MEVCHGLQETRREESDRKARREASGEEARSEEEVKRLNCASFQTRRPAGIPPCGLFALNLHFKELRGDSRNSAV